MKVVSKESLIKSKARHKVRKVITMSRTRNSLVMTPVTFGDLLFFSWVGLSWISNCIPRLAFTGN